ncbi:MAG: dynein gamma chain protein [Coriobacteriia bacterium]|nr:dynein gamma chain protein [Coriobacteriia bacterium]
MCANGVNTEQYKMMIDYMDDTLAVNRRWIHKMAHTVEDNGYAKTSEVMHQVQALLDDARALLTDAKDAIEEDDEKLGGVTVSLV